MTGRKDPRLAAPPTTPQGQAQAGVYQDDEPLEHLVAPIAGATKLLHLATPPPTPHAQVCMYNQPLEHRTAGPAANGGLVLKTQCEFPALGRGASRDKFAVLVHARAPADVARAPLDLVTVLDVSGSMDGEKLAQLKAAMGFVIDQLGPDDRLSIVSFSGEATRLIPLTRMTVAGKGTAKLAVEGMIVRWTGTNIGEGLRVGAQVLAGRRHKNVVASMILLSDGGDTDMFYAVETLRNVLAGKKGGARDYMTLVPPSFTHAGTRPGPIHTFGFGIDNDPVPMHTIAEATGGTFSFIENQTAIKDSFAQCIGGLLSVAVQAARITVTCLHRGVRVQEVKSGCYCNHVGADGHTASIDVGELYDDEERRFLLLLHVPRVRPTESVTRLVKVRCTYKDAATGQTAQVAAPAAVINRMLELELTGMSIDVERERVRLAAAQDMAAALVAADGGKHAGAIQILDSGLKAVEQSAPGAAGDPTCELLKEELRDLSARVRDPQEYQQTGRSCLLASMSSHAQQRASASTTTKPRAYLTLKMEEMVEVSREQSRKRCSSQQPWNRLKQIKQDTTDKFGS